MTLMAGGQTAVVTGAYSFTGSAVARSLMKRGFTVRTLTNRGAPVNDPGGSIDSLPLRFDEPAALVAALKGADVFVNTYWVRYPYVGVGFEKAVENIGVLLSAAREAGVGRVVHVSVSNPSPESPLAYYRGKARAEALVRGLGLPYAIVRPTLIVGTNDILTNNIAWFLRRFPVFGMPGSGEYRVQPVTLDDVGEIVVGAALTSEDITLDAAGPETMTFEEYVEEVGRSIGRPRRIVHLPPRAVLAMLRAVGWLKGEVILSREELDGLMTDLLVSHEPSRGTASVREWLRAHGQEMGRSYASEFARHVRD